MFYSYTIVAELAPQDRDLKDRIPAIIRDRFQGTAVRVAAIVGPHTGAVVEIPEGNEGDDPEEGGVSEPAGDSPDSPAPGEAGLQDPGGQFFPIDSPPGILGKLMDAFSS